MTPAYAIKHWWRAARRDGESLRAFSRRHAGYTGDTTAARWLKAKGIPLPGRSS